MKMMRIRLSYLLWLMIPIALVFTFAARVARELTAGRASVCLGHMHSIGIALLNYRDRSGRFPPAFLADPAGKPTHGWRAYVAAEISDDFGRAYSFREPWDTPRNLKAAEGASGMFGCPNDQDDTSRFTSYVAIIDGDRSSLDPVDVPAGGTTENERILVVEYPNSKIPWTEPKDVTVDELAKITEVADPGGIGVIQADARVVRLSRAELLKRLAVETRRSQFPSVPRVGKMTLRKGRRRRKKQD